MSKEKMPVLLTCQELDRFMVDYIEGHLSFWQRWKFNLHLFSCSKCRAYLEGYKKSVELGKQVFAEQQKSVAEQAPEELIQAILNARPK
jgi:anti-sigma factor RsiW